MLNLFTKETKLQITETAYDLFYVDIQSKAMLYKTFDYIIYGEGRKMLRRGNFRSPSVQLRTSDLKEGTYEFALLLDGQEYQTASFQKCNKA